MHECKKYLNRICIGMVPTHKGVGVTVQTDIARCKCKLWEQGRLPWHINYKGKLSRYSQTQWVPRHIEHLKYLPNPDHFSCVFSIRLLDAALLELYKILVKTAFFEKNSRKMPFLASSGRCPAFLEFGLVINLFVSNFF